jgi:hypothetical protein
MVIMDTSIIGVALSKIQGDVGFTPDSLSWVFNTYVIALGGLLVLHQHSDRAARPGRHSRVSCPACQPGAARSTLQAP